MLHFDDTDRWVRYLIERHRVQELVRGLNQRRQRQETRAAELAGRVQRRQGFRDAVQQSVASFGSRHTRSEDRVARLFLLSDVLHNSGSIKQAAARCYRTEFEASHLKLCACGTCSV